eukprot:gene3735-biopygen2725
MARAACHNSQGGHCSIARTLPALDEMGWLRPQAGTLGGRPTCKHVESRPAGLAAGLAPLSYCWRRKLVTVIPRYRIPPLPSSPVICLSRYPRYRYLPLPLSRFPLSPRYHNPDPAHPPGLLLQLADRGGRPESCPTQRAQNSDSYHDPDGGLSQTQVGLSRTQTGI